MGEGVYIEVGEAVLDIEHRRATVTICVTSKHDEPRKVLAEHEVVAYESIATYRRSASENVEVARQQIALPHDWFDGARNGQCVSLGPMHWYALRQAVHRAMLAFDHAFLGKATPDMTPAPKHQGRDSDEEAMQLVRASELLASERKAYRDRCAKLEVDVAHLAERLRSNLDSIQKTVNLAEAGVTYDAANDVWLCVEALARIAAGEPA